MGDPKEQAVLHILMLPWLAHGHLSPFLELAKRLSHTNILVHFCSTPINLSSIRDQLNDKAFPSIKLVELHLPTLPGLPPQLHTTKYLPSHLMPTLKTAFDLAEPSFCRILESLNPDLLIYDFIQPWAPKAARQHNIPAIQFLTTGAASTALFCHYLKNPTEKFPFMGIISESPKEDADYTDMLNRIANGITDADRLLECMNLSSNFVAIKTFKEIESKYIDYLSSLMGKEILPVGPLVPDSCTMDEAHESSRNLIEWLSKKERSSVVFVSFGSEYFMSSEEIEELAQGLELSKVSFIWVIRFPKQQEEEEEEEERILQGARELPRGFRERINDVGLVLEGWAPQREILTHPSIGGFLTHCGWSSVMEGMRCGVPMIALPMQLDQPVNAKLVVEIGVGVEIKREKAVLGGFWMFKREEVAKGIRYVVVNEEGEGVRRKAKEMAELMGLKGNELEMQSLVGKMDLLCKGRKERKVDII